MSNILTPPHHKHLFDLKQLLLSIPTVIGRYRKLAEDDPLPVVNILKEFIAQKEYIYPPRPSMRLITDVFAVRADFAKDHPDIVKGLVAGIFEGMSDVAKDPHPAYKWLADGYSITVEEVEKIVEKEKAADHAP